jgi:hypothetical protein
MDSLVIRNITLMEKNRVYGKDGMRMNDLHIMDSTLIGRDKVFGKNGMIMDNLKDVYTIMMD